MKFTKFPEVKKRREVYLDHAAATPLDSRVKEAMLPYLGDNFGNPGGLYKVARSAKTAVDNARRTVANAFSAQPRNIIFTGSGTESINLAIFGIARKYSPPLQGGARGGIQKNKSEIYNLKSAIPRGHVITTQIEHHAVLHSIEALEKEGFEATYLKTDEYGLVTPEQVAAALREDTLLVSIMYANNEIGTILPIADIGRAILKWKKKHNRKSNQPPFFHTDACQATNYLEIDVSKLHVDLMTVNGSKIYGPRGTGVLYKSDKIKLTPLIYGGGQESRLRAGTENVAGIVGLAKALEIARGAREEESKRLIELRNYLTDEIMKRIPKVVINGHPENRLPNNVNVSILDIEGEALLLYMDEYGVSMSTGSACTSESLDPSHVILAIGKPYEYAHGSMRFSLGRSTTKDDLDYMLELLPPIVERLREISPVNLKLEKKLKNNQPSMAAAFVEDGKPHWMKERSE